MEKRSQFTPYLLVILFAVLATNFGCSDKFFEEQAGDRITPDQHYKSLNDADVSFMGAMIPLQDYMPKLIMLDGLRTDMMDVTPFADAYFKEINDQSFSLGNPYIDPSDLYKVIINANEVLANVAKIKLKDRNFDDYIIHYARGGLITLRSWAYLTIVRLYGEAAYLGDNMTTLPENLEQNILSKDVMIDTLINQLTLYIYDPLVETEREELQIGGYPNTKALLGELYLEKNDYTNAAKFLKMACESYGNSTVGYKVDKTYTKEAWLNIFIGSEYAYTETIAVIPFSSTEGQFNPLPRWMLYSDQYMVKPSQVLIDSFQTQIQLKNLVGDAYRGMNFTYDTTDAGELYISKYSLDAGEPYSTDIIISRAADVHLLLAEALNRMGDAESQKYALLLLNAGFNSTNPKPAAYNRWSSNLGVRGRAYLLAKTPPIDLTGDALIEYIEDLIIQERAMELAFEGKRWFDLVRIAQRRDNPEYLAGRIAAKYKDPTEAARIHGILMQKANWVLPYKK
jgi:hypothetical protein